MKTVVIASAATVALVGAAVWALVADRPARAAGQEEIATSCTWTEVRLCYAGQNNGCCPKPKDKPQYSAE